ncbi:hypothetical protein ACHAWF_002531 [Thalassiosira exigua]
MASMVGPTNRIYSASRTLRLRGWSARAEAGFSGSRSGDGKPIGVTGGHRHAESHVVTLCRRAAMTCSRTSLVPIERHRYGHGVYRRSLSGNGDGKVENNGADAEADTDVEINEVVKVEFDSGEGKRKKRSVDSKIDRSRFTHEVKVQFPEVGDDSAGECPPLYDLAES